MEEKDKAIRSRAKRVQTLPLLFVLGMAAFIFLFRLKNSLPFFWPLLLGASFLASGLYLGLAIRRGKTQVFFWGTLAFAFTFFLTYVTFITPVFLGYKTPHQFCNRVKEIVEDGRLLTFRYDELYIVNELDRQIENIRSERKLRGRLRREGGMFVITNFKGMEKIKGEDLEIRVLASQKPFLKRRRPIVLLYIKEKDEGGGR